MDYFSLLDLSHTLAGGYLSSFCYPWQALAGLGAFIEGLLPLLGEQYRCIASGVYVHETATVASTACLTPPCIVGARTQVRQGAYVRGRVLVGEDCVVGNSTELKNCILFDGVQVPHFNYAGDSILGYRAHLGAGAILSNVRLDGKTVTVQGIDTGLKKFGAIVGDCVQVGCNSVINPGTVLCRGVHVLPLSFVKGILQN